MKIAVVHPRMSVLGGAESVAIHSLKAGLREGNTVSLISEDFDQNRVEKFYACEGLFSKIERITYPVFKPRLMGTFLLYRQLFYHRRHIQKLLSNHPDLELVLSTQDVGYIPSTKANVIHYCYFPDYFSHIEVTPSSRWWNVYYWPARRYYHGRVNHVNRLLSTSNYTRELVKKVWNRDSTTLYPPCSVEMYMATGEPKEDLVVTVGRIVPEKRFELFLEIARGIPSLKFVVVGSIQADKTKYYESLQKVAPANCSFIIAPLRETKEILARAKVYVHSAQNEQFGIAIVEALAAGCVPVVHDSGGPKEIVTDEVGFRWTCPGQAVGQILSIMKDDEIRLGFARNALRRANLFNSERFETILSEILNSYNSKAGSNASN